MVQHNQQLEKFKPPEIISTEDGLECLLTFIRTLKGDQLDDYLTATGLLIKLQDFLEKECNGVHDSEVSY